ncbi:hypothetical protein C8J56DRAFT_1061890 [Mycena floridula]|nr:hypothetical protein C8J56DRAFT_1061890 [Mycena floridula]
MPARISDAKRWLFRAPELCVHSARSSWLTAEQINALNPSFTLAVDMRCGGYFRARGHDWYALLVHCNHFTWIPAKGTSRIANYYPERFSAYAFLAVAYGPPESTYADPIAQSKRIKETLRFTTT